VDQKVDHHNLSLCFISKVRKQVLTSKGTEKTKLDQDSTAKKQRKKKSYSANQLRDNTFEKKSYKTLGHMVPYKQ